MKRKKSKFWLFVFSLCPGAGHLYLGLMKMGLSFLLGFMLSIVLVSLTQLDVLAVIPITIYIYALFHANNIGSLDDAQFDALEDVYLLGFDSIGTANFRLEGKVRNIAAVILILIGVSMLWELGFGILRENYFGYDNPLVKFIYYTVRNSVPRIVMAIAIIWFGVYLLRGKKVSEDTLRIEEKPGAEKAGSRQVIDVPDAQSGQSEQEK